MNTATLSKCLARGDLLGLFGRRGAFAEAVLETARDRLEVAHAAGAVGAAAERLVRPPD